MGKYDRLTNYIYDYFPEKKYSTKDIRDWAKENVPAWSHISSSDRGKILGDWENFIASTVEEELGEVIEGVGYKTPSFWSRIKSFLGRLFGGKS